MEQTTPAHGSTPAATHTWNLVPGNSSLLVAKDSGTFDKSKITWPSGQFPVGATRGGWLATRNALWNYNRWTPLKRHLAAMNPQAADLFYLLDTGLGVAEMKFPSIENPPSETRTYLLLSVGADGVPAAPNPAVADSLALGVDRISMLASGGAGRIDQIGVMAPIDGSRTVRLLTPTSVDMKLKLACDVATFTPDTLSGPDMNIAVVGKDPAGELLPQSDGQVTLTHLTSGQNATNAPLVFKRMKHRTVKVAMHKVFSVDANGNTVAPLHVPTKAELELYLNNIYGPQVNLSFVVTPEDEGTATAGINFDLGSKDGMLYANDDLEVDAVTLDAKSGGANPSANIDVWVIGGDVTLAYSEPLSTLKKLAYGYRMPNTKHIIVDGNVLRTRQPQPPLVPAGTEMNHLLHTIAHEIGHVMTNDQHPGEEGYHSELLWEGGKDPYIKKRLMCAGSEADHNNGGTCLIKKEWDRIEVWLKYEEDNGRL